MNFSKCLYIFRGYNASCICSKPRATIYFVRYNISPIWHHFKLASIHTNPNIFQQLFKALITWRECVGRHFRFNYAWLCSRTYLRGKLYSRNSHTRLDHALTKNCARETFRSTKRLSKIMHYFSNINLRWFYGHTLWQARA